eukprot:g4338.t2
MSSFRIDEVAYRLVSSKWFDRVIIATIVVNCCFLALNDPTKPSTEQDELLIVGDYTFSAIFIAELLAKWLALSIPTYFKDNWNWVDFIVVLESVTSLVLKAFRSTSDLDISALRALRVKLLFETVISAFRAVNTLLLCVGFVILFFGNVGHTYWADAFQNTCYLDPISASGVLSEDLVCGKGYPCPDGYVCSDSGHVAINHGVTGYHDIWHAMLQVFQVVSLDGWQQVMWHTQDAAGEETWVFFVVVLVIGNAILVSMFPAVLSSKLEAAIAHEEGRKRKKMIQAENGREEVTEAAKNGDRASEFEMLLNEYSKIDADEIAAIERMAAVRRGEIREEPEEEKPLPPWTPFPANATLNRLRKALEAELGPFSIFVYVVIFLNSVVLCLDSATASERRQRVLSGFNEAFTSLFVVELAIKVGLLGPVGYFSDGFNVFDFTITVLGLIEITIKAGGFISGFRVVRIFRVARVFRLATLGKLGRKKFNASPQVDMGRMVSIILTSIPWVVNIYVVQLLLMYTFTVLGMQFFGGKLNEFNAEADNSIRFNYNSFGKAAATLLDLLTGNLWDELMFDTVEATGQETGVVFYVAWLVLSRWLTVAMVVTVLFNRINVDTEDYLKIAAKTSMHSVFALERAFMQCHKSHAFLVWRKRYEEAAAHRSSTRGQMKLLEYRPPSAQPGLWQRIVTSKRSLLLFEPTNRVRRLCVWLASPVPVTPPTIGEPPKDVPGSVAGVLPGSGGSSSARGKSPSPSSVEGRYNEGGCWKRFLERRRKKHRRLARAAFQSAEVLAVVAILVVVAVDVEIFSGRRAAADRTTGAVRALETAAVSAFLAQALVVIVARGLVLLPGAYLRRSSSVLGFALTVLSTACLWPFGNSAPGGEGLWLSAVKALRALNALRLVRLARLSHSLMDLLRALRSSGKALCLAGAVVLSFWIQWSIVGLQVWGGTFNFCSNPATAEEHEQSVFYVYRTEENGMEGQSECEEAGLEWRNAEWNFDHIGNALQSVLVIFTYNGWQDILFHAINARVSADGLNAEAWHNTWAAVFFLCVILISLVLALLLVGVVFSMYTFTNLTKRSGRRLSSLKQAFWTMYETKLAKVQPDTVPACPADAPALRRRLFDAASSPRWNAALACLVGANVEALFAAVLVVEWVCRAVAFGGVRAITRSHFQVADALATLVLALVFIEEIIFHVSPTSAHSAFWTAVEAVSMIRLVRLGHVLPNAAEFLLVAAKSSSVIFPLLLVLTLLTYLWSVCGVVCFGGGTYLAGLFGGHEGHETENRHQGFFGVAQGMQTMLGVATTPGSNGWVTLMRAYEDATAPRWRWAVVVFFGSYAFLTRFLLVQFFMMTLLFKYKTHSTEKAGVAIEQVNQFKHAWMRHAYRYTKEYTSIYAGQLVDFLKELPPPLGVGPEGSYYDCQILAKKVLFAMGIDVFTHIPAQDLADVMPLFNNADKRGSVKAQLRGNGPGLLRLNFSKVLVAVHRIVLFDLTLEDERQVNERRNKARTNLSVLKLGVHHFLAMRAKRVAATTRAQLESIALAECSLLRTQLPATFRARISIALTAEFLRWKDHVDLRGYDHEANMMGQCLLKAASHEIAAAAALEQLTSRLCESRIGDRKLLASLVEIRQHVVALRELRVKLDTARGDYLRTTWDGGSLCVRQTFDDGERGPGISGVCGSADGTWVFCATDNGLLKVFKRGRAPRPKRKHKTRQQGTYALVQSLNINGGDVFKSGKSGIGAIAGLCVACSSDGFFVMLGCSDTATRTYSQDTAGLRRAVHAMKAEGVRGRKPTVLYRLSSVSKGHKAAIRCAAWLEPGYFYTGGDDGVVCMWRGGAGKRPVQAIDVCRSTFSSSPVRCLTVWRTTYSIELLAACLDVDDNQADDAAAVTAIEVAWGRVYSASGLSGVVKAWTPLWADATKETLLGFSQAGQYAVHSGVVSSIVYTKGLMFSAASDLSIVTWYPPRESYDTAVPPTLAHAAQASPLEAETPRARHGRHHSGSTEEPSPAMLPPPSPAEMIPTASSPPAVGDDVRGGVAHESDPGVVVHVAGVVGMAVIPGGVISADLAGRVLERGPKKLIESHRTQMLPGEEVIERLRPLALEVLRTRARARPGGAAVTAPGMTSNAPQASLDHLCAVRSLLRAKAKRRLKEEIKAEKKRAEDLKTATVFAARLGGQPGGVKRSLPARPVLGADRVPRDSTSSNRSSASETAARARRRTILCSVSMRDVEGQDGGDVSQETADVIKIADMDQTPAFLEAADLERLAKHPEIYLAELMMHFFPGRDLAPPRRSGSTEAPASASTRAARARITRPSVVGGGSAAKRVPLLDRVKATRRSVTRGIPALGGGGGGKLNLMFQGATSSVSNTADAARRVPATKHVRSRSSAHGPPLSGSVARVDGEDHREDGGQAGQTLLGEGAKGGGDGGRELATMEVGLRGVTTQATRGTITPTANLGALLQRATRAEGGAGEAEREDLQEKYNEREQEIQSVPPALQSGKHHLQEPCEENESKAASIPSVSRSSSPLPHSQTEAAAVSPASSLLSHRPDAAAFTLVPNQANISPDEDDPSYVGDNFSTIQLRRQGGALTVYVPRSPPASGAWAASVAYDGERDVAWVLAEALRMYGTEHEPILQHAGLARRPRLVPRRRRGAPQTRWGGLFQAADDDCGNEWEPAVALSPASPVRSVLTPGEELVVLVGGWEPGLAFARRPSVTASPPPPGPAFGRTAGRRGLEPARGREAAEAAWGHRVGAGVTPLACGEDEEARYASCWRAPSDGARRLAGGSGEAARNAGRALGPLPGERGKPGNGGIGDIPESDYRQGTEVVETRGGHQAKGLRGFEVRGAPGADYIAAADEKENGDGEDGDSGSSLTDEDEEHGERTCYYRYHNPAFEHAGGGGIRGDGLVATAAQDVSVTTKGVEERHEDGGDLEAEIDGRLEAGGWVSRGTLSDGGEGFPEPRSPPRSLVSAMFSAWGNS